MDGNCKQPSSHCEKSDLPSADGFLDLNNGTTPDHKIRYYQELKGKERNNAPPGEGNGNSDNGDEGTGAATGKQGNGAEGTGNPGNGAASRTSGQGAEGEGNGAPGNRAVTGEGNSGTFNMSISTIEPLPTLYSGNDNNKAIAVAIAVARNKKIGGKREKNIFKGGGGEYNRLAIELLNKLMKKFMPGTIIDAKYLQDYKFFPLAYQIGEYFTSDAGKPEFISIIDKIKKEEITNVQTLTDLKKISDLCTSLFIIYTKFESQSNPIHFNHSDMTGIQKKLLIACLMNKEQSIEYQKLSITNYQEEISIKNINKYLNSLNILRFDIKYANEFKSKLISLALAMAIEKQLEGSAQHLQPNSASQPNTSSQQSNTLSSLNLPSINTKELTTTGPRFHGGKRKQKKHKKHIQSGGAKEIITRSITQKIINDLNFFSSYFT
jgi:hypothetical protein